MSLNLRILKAVESNAKRLLDVLTYIRISGKEASELQSTLNRMRAISELLDEQVHKLYDQAKEPH